MSTIMSERVLLGFPDDRILSENETNWSTNKIGGVPDLFPTVSLNQLQFRCQICGRVLALLVQLYCPLGISKFHRVLYVFCCVNEACWNKPESWKVVRSQYLLETESAVLEKEKQMDQWHLEEDDWGDGNSEMDFEDPACKFLVDTTERMGLHSESEESTIDLPVVSCSAEGDDPSVIAQSPPKVSAAPFLVSDSCKVPIPEHLQPIICPLFINVFEEAAETEKAISSAEHVRTLMENYYVKDGNPFYKTSSGNNNQISSLEGYEQTQVKHGDKTFYKFQKVVSHNPSQIIRYSWKGQPLHMFEQCKSANEEMAPPCQHCGSKRVFEVQLMPMLIHSLKLQNLQLSGPPVEFGTVIVNTCERSCWAAKSEDLKEEHLSIQVDPSELEMTRLQTSV